MDVQVRQPWLSLTMKGLQWVVLAVCQCCLAKDAEVTLLKTASNENPLNRLVNSYVPFSNRRAILRYQSLYVAADLKQAGMRAGYTIDTIALRVASPANTFDAPILNNVRWAYQWLSPLTVSSYTQLQPSALTYNFKYLVGSYPRALELVWANVGCPCSCPRWSTGPVRSPPLP